MHEVLEQINRIGIVPVVVLERAEDAAPLAEALLLGGISCAEITFRTDAAEEAIRIISEKYPQMLVGAGTVLTKEQADRAKAAGAKFMVSPGFNPRVVENCLEKGILMIPGVSSPGEVEAAMEMGLEAVKFFPAESAGGLKFLQAIAAPYAKMRYMPTGGIHGGNFTEYLAFDKVLACGGSWMVKGDLIARGDFAEISALARQAVSQMLGFTLEHVGINCADLQEAKEISDTFFAGHVVKAMKSPYRGQKGHIAIGTNHVERALHYLEQQGVKAVTDTAKYKNGKLSAIYIDQEIGGFAVHLVQK